MILFAFLITFLQANLIPNVSSRSPGLDCSKRDSEGLYGRGCSSKFMRCYNGELYVYKCSENLKFNVETAKCDERREVIACINNMDNDQSVVKAVDTFNCSKRKDGVYGNGRCSKAYFHCSQGYSMEIPCPAGLYYNDKLKGCDEIHRINECTVLAALQGYSEHRESYLGKHTGHDWTSTKNGRISDRNGIYTAGISESSLGRRGRTHHSNQKEQPARQNLHTTSLWEPGKEWNCTGMKDGNYPMANGQCLEHFWHCSNGKTTRRVCRNGMFFNAINGECDISNNIKDCLQKKEATLVETQRKNSPEQKKEKQLNDAATIDRAFCKTLNDGVYFDGCASKYIVCSRSATFAYNCPEGQIMDPTNKICNEPKNVPECMKQG